MSFWGYAIGCWTAFGIAVALSRRLRRQIAADGPEALVWAAVLSAFLGFGVEQLNARIPLWTHLGPPYGEPWRTVAQGLAFASMVPTVAAIAYLVEPSLAKTRRPPAAIFLLATSLGVAAVLLRGRTLDGSMATALAALLLAVDGWNGRRGRPSLPAFGASRSLVALVTGAALWTIVDRLASAAFPPGRIYIGFSSTLWLAPLLALMALTAWASYVAAAAMLGRPLLLIQGEPDGHKEPIKIFS